MLLNFILRDVFKATLVTIEVTFYWGCHLGSHHVRRVRDIFGAFIIRSFTVGIIFLGCFLKDPIFFVTFGSFYVPTFLATYFGRRLVLLLGLN